ncbi:MAG: hypothetical protein J07HQW1_00570 [Haloquadratum walsbyi J07HQW1]|uniref:Uncharacterized protein n=1 Tax=Haloquadratum walsbyi J07HQW1 TaxID=1238424 RepID=U1PAG8_9EURY|nr:MAG: hypothetical protein J07HQW1_00570 [Haloquadratum walsbyi J07HQW1]
MSLKGLIIAIIDMCQIKSILLLTLIILSASVGFIGSTTAVTGIELTQANVEIESVNENQSTQTVTVGSEFTVSGVTNRDPDNTVIIVELRRNNGEVVRVATDEQWDESGEWRVTIELGDVEAGSYVIEASTGDETDIRELTVVAATPTPTVTPDMTPTPTPTPTRRRRRRQRQRRCHKPRRQHRPSQRHHHRHRRQKRLDLILSLRL